MFRLWVETVNTLWPDNQKTHPPYTHQNIVKDPLIMLRCDTRVFRYMGETDSHKLKFVILSQMFCSLEILLRILAAY